MPINGPALAFVLAAVLAWFVGQGVVDGAKWVGHEAKKAGTAVVHVVKKLHHHLREDDAQ